MQEPTQVDANLFLYPKITNILYFKRKLVSLFVNYSNDIGFFGSRKKRRTTLCINIFEFCIRKKIVMLELKIFHKHYTLS